MTSTCRRLALIIALLAPPSRAQFFRAYTHDGLPRGIDGALDLARTADGGYAMLSLEGITKVSAAGELEWSYTYVGSNLLSLYHIAASRTGRIAAIGRLDTFPESITFVIVDQSGRLLVTETLGTGVPNDIVTTPDGGFAIAANATVTKVDGTGQVQWVQSYGAMIVRSLAVLADGTLVAAGERWDPGGTRRGLMVLLLTSSGTVNWRLWDALPNADGGWGTKMLPLPDGDLVISTGFQVAGSDRPLQVLRLRPRIGPSWSRLLHVPEFVSGTGSSGMGMLSDGSIGIVAWGGSPGPSVGSDGHWVVNISPSGDVTWQRSLGGIYVFIGATGGPPPGGLVMSGIIDVGMAKLGVLCQLTLDGWTDNPCAAISDVSACVENLAACYDPGEPLTATPEAAVSAPLSYVEAPGLVETTCMPFACQLPQCNEICVEPGSRDGAARLRLAHELGTGAVQVAWDLDGDGATDLVGNPVVAPLAAGTHVVTATATDSCVAPAPGSCALTATVDVPVAPTVDRSDADGDGVCDAIDNCPSVPNVDQADTDRDRTGDACDNDLDADTIPNDVDNCPRTSNRLQDDNDADGVGDACDNCRLLANPGQADADLDRRGDDCDDCPFAPDAGQDDRDADGVGDACDDCASVADPSQADGDGDRAGDACDKCPMVADPTQADADADAVGDACDDCPLAADPAQSDADGDAAGDACDVCPSVSDPAQGDANGDGIGDACDPLCAEIAALDADASAIPLRVERAGPAQLRLSWDGSAGLVANAYEGAIASLWISRSYSHASIGACGIGLGEALVSVPARDAYYLVAARCTSDSSLGRDSLGGERPAAAPACP